MKYIIVFITFVLTLTVVSAENIISLNKTQFQEYSHFTVSIERINRPIAVSKTIISLSSGTFENIDTSKSVASSFVKGLENGSKVLDIEAVYFGGISNVSTTSLEILSFDVKSSEDARIELYEGLVYLLGPTKKTQVVAFQSFDIASSSPPVYNIKPVYQEALENDLNISALEQAYIPKNTYNVKLQNRVAKTINYYYLFGSHSEVDAIGKIKFQNPMQFGDYKGGITFYVESPHGIFYYRTVNVGEKQHFYIIIYLAIAVIISLVLIKLSKESNEKSNTHN